jgi:predicted transcriptional regulator
MREGPLKKTIIVGGTLRDAAARVAEACHRAERGDAVEPQDTITFATGSALALEMTDRRRELLCQLRDHPGSKQPTDGA